jgi:hypothetical protein
MSTTQQPTIATAPNAAWQRRAVRQTALLMAGTAALAVGAVALGTALDHDTGAATPEGTVRSFLMEAAIENNGVVACRYLTSGAVRRLAAVEPRDTSCENALRAARLTVGGRLIEQESALKALDYRVEQSGERARVTVSGNGAARSFMVRRATASELDEFQPPPTHWRVDGGVNALLTAP